MKTFVVQGKVACRALLLGALVTLLAASGHRSYVELPALHRHCGGRCRPLAVPNLIRGN